MSLTKWRMRAKAFVYMIVLLASTPVACTLLMPSFALALVVRMFKQVSSPTAADGRKVVLVTGAPHTKGLQMCRILSSAGHRVILADMLMFSWSAARFSSSVSKWVTLPNVTEDEKEGYKAALMSLIEEEGVDWWIPISHTSTAVLDTEVTVHLNIHGGKVKVLCLEDVEMAEVLDDKLRFLESAMKLGLPVPTFFKIHSTQDIKELRDKGTFLGDHFFLKPMSAYSEDRECFTRIPHNKEELVSFLSSYEHKISQETPYFVSKYVKGKEYTGAVICRQGQINVFISNPSSPVQIDYTDAAHKTQIYDWLVRFVSGYKLSGSLCFDFMEDPGTGEMFCIECNPRMHSCIVLSDHKRVETAQAIYQAMEGPADSNTVHPSIGSRPVYWLYNELAQLTGKGAGPALSRIMRGRDAVWDLEDPLPFFLLPHLQMPWLLFERVLSGQRWTIVNFCLGQIR